MSPGDRMDLFISIVISLLFVLVFINTAILEKLLSRDLVAAKSLGGGLAVSYVFLELLPEVDHGHELIGEAIEFVILIGFLVVFGLHRLVHHRARSSRHGTFLIQFVIACAYIWLLVYTFPIESGLYALGIGLLLLVHMVFFSYSLREENKAAYDRWGRWGIVLASLVGCGSVWLIGPASPLLGDIFIGVLAGTIIHQVFTIEIPGAQSVRFSWFLAGVLLFAAIYIVTELAGPVEENEAADRGRPVASMMG